jgi:hypothetical protein
MAKRKEYLQMLYYTNKTIFDRFYEQLITFFADLNKFLEVESFPIHAEFKLDSSRRLIPVEFNTCRFGGMGLADLTFYAFNYNPIKAYFDDFVPDWQSIWSTRKKMNYCWILGYNAADLDTASLKPNHEKFKQLLPRNTQLLAYKELNHKKSAGFALAYLSTNNSEDIEKILSIEFNECF